MVANSFNINNPAITPSPTQHFTEEHTRQHGTLSHLRITVRKPQHITLTTRNVILLQALSAAPCSFPRRDPRQWYSKQLLATPVDSDASFSLKTWVRLKSETK